MFIHGMKRVGGLKKGSFFSFELERRETKQHLSRNFCKPAVMKWCNSASNRGARLLSQIPRELRNKHRDQEGDFRASPFTAAERHKEETSRRPFSQSLSFSGLVGFPRGVPLAKTSPWQE